MPPVCVWCVIRRAFRILLSFSCVSYKTIWCCRIEKLLVCVIDHINKICSYENYHYHFIAYCKFYIIALALFYTNYLLKLHTLRTSSSDELLNNKRQIKLESIMILCKTLVIIIYINWFVIKILSFLFFENFLQFIYKFFK